MMLHRALFVMWLVGGAAGCDAIFGRPFEADDAPPDDTRSDAPATDAGACVMPTVATDFVEGPPCAGFGSPNAMPGTAGAAEMYIAAEQLHIDPPPRTQASNGCTVDEMDLGEEGVFLQLVEVFAYPNATTYFQIFDAGLGDIAHVALVIRENRVALHGPSGATGDSAPYQAGHWWRLRPDPQGIVAETSSDGRSWSMFGTVLGIPPQRVKLVFGATVEDTGAAAPGRVRVEHINVCP